MDFYYYIAILAIASQAIFLWHILMNFRFALSKYKRNRHYQPPAALIVPCKGLDESFKENISSFFNQDYENYTLYFVVEDIQDPARQAIADLKNSLANTSKARDIKILISGKTKSCSQKIHNLIYAYNNITSDTQIIAFADSDACARTDWLRHIAYPLRQEKIGVASGYRWFVPEKNNLPTLALSAINAKVAQLLGNSRLNHAWGGSMAIRIETFRQLGIDKLWQTTLSDDLSLSTAVRKAKLKVAFVPACLVASYETTSWPKLFEFGRRQFLITRINAPGTWAFGLFSALFGFLGLWATAAIAIYARSINHHHATLYTTVPIFFFVCQFLRAIARQFMAAKLLKKDLNKMKFAIAADILFFWAWTILLLFLILSSALGRTITWRNIRYKLISPTQTIVLNPKT